MDVLIKLLRGARSGRDQVYQAGGWVRLNQGGDFR